MGNPRRFQLATERLAPLPIVNHFLDRLQIDELLDRCIPTRDRRCRLPYARALGVLLRCLIVEREPIYRHQQTVAAFAPELFGLLPWEVDRLTDDVLGRALDRLFDADRGSLITQVVVAARRRFGVQLDELHNDATSVSLTGQYRAASGRRLRGKRALWITYGYSRDHRPDLKQLLLVLTTSGDGGVPVQFRCEDGNVSNAATHQQTWETLCAVAGRADFLYVADSKLCSSDPMEHIDRLGGRFVTVMPRSRLEDRQFRRWIQTHEPGWELVVDRPHPRRDDGPRDRWWAFCSPLPSQEGWPVVWVFSSLLALAQQQGRLERIAKAVQGLEDLQARLVRRRSRLKDQVEIERAVQQLLGSLHVGRYLKVDLERGQEHHYRQVTAGRPGPTTRYRRVTRGRFALRWRLDETAVAYDRKSDGMYPLLTNDRRLSPAQVLQAHKRQPVIEKRFEQLKTVHEIAPVCLKNEGRIEAFFLIYFLALLVQALIEREMRRTMAKEQIRELPLYPERRRCRRPTTEQILRLFSCTQRHQLLRHDREIQVFDPQLSELQREVLRLLGVSQIAYRTPA